MPRIWKASALTRGEPTMGASSMIVTCKACKQRFNGDEWMKKTTCDNPNCSCPGVKELTQKTSQVMEKMRSGPVQNIKRGTLPTGYLAEVKQYMMDVPDVMVVDIIVPKQHFSKKRK